VAVAYLFVVADEIEVRAVRESEFAAAGEATARAYREFIAPGEPGLEAYVARIADIGARVGNAVVLVALVDGVVAGSATLEIDSRVTPSSAEPLAPDEAHLRMLGVSPEHRGRGVARRLVEACIELARDRGKRRLTLDTAPVMVAAQGLYSSMGFTPTSGGRTADGSSLLGYTLTIESDAGVSR
jgi:ribosomal protein S18 acetylase RimI-like enzyme